MCAILRCEVNGFVGCREDEDVADGASPNSTRPLREDVLGSLFLCTGVCSGVRGITAVVGSSSRAVLALPGRKSGSSMGA